MPQETMIRAAFSRVEVRSPNDFDVILEADNGQEIALQRVTGFTLNVQINRAPTLQVQCVLPDVEAKALADTLLSVTTHEELIERWREERATPGPLIAAELADVVEELRARAAGQMDIAGRRRAPGYPPMSPWSEL